MPRVKSLPAKRSAAVERWVALAAAYDKSKLTLRAFAALHEVNAHSLSWWRRRRQATPSASGFVEVARPALSAPAPAALHWAPAPVAAPTLRLELPRLGARVPVPVGTDLAWLRDVLGALELLRIKASDRRNQRYDEAEAAVIPLPFIFVEPAPPPRRPQPEPVEPEVIAPKARQPAKRRNLSQPSARPVRVLRCAIDSATRCARCGGPLKVFAVAHGYRLEWVRGHFQTPDIERERGACPGCPAAGVLVAPPPSFALPKVMCGNGLLARVLVDKFADRIPLNLQAKRMAREGEEFSTTTLSDWVLHAAAPGLLGRIAAAIDERLRFLALDRSGMKTYSPHLDDPCAPRTSTLAGAALRWCKVYAVVTTGGKQYRVSEGTQLVVDRLAAEVGSTMEFTDVLMIGGDSPKVGAPHVAGARVKATVVAHESGEKTEYVRYLHRRRTRTQKNGRAKLTILQINGIEG